MAAVPRSLCLLAALLEVGASQSSIVTFPVLGREVDAAVPACATSSSSIILSLHAWGTGKRLQRSVDGLPELAARDCAIVVYPQGFSRGAWFGMLGFAWNAGGCCPNANNEHIDDVGFLREVITATAAKFNTSSESAFVVGVSNGGMMANRLACEDERVQAFVAVSGPLVNGTGSSKQETFTCTRRVPILHFHGQADTTVPFDGCNSTSVAFNCKHLQKTLGDEIAAFPDVPTYIAGWRRRNGLASDVPARVTYQRGTATCSSWGGAANNVTLCTLSKEGHAWPGSCSVVNKLPGFTCTEDIDASQQAIDFFRHYMPAKTVFV